MKRYNVTWGGEPVEVVAVSEGDAWSAYCAANDLARKHPKLHERKVAEATAPPKDTKPVVASKK